MAINHNGFAYQDVGIYHDPESLCKSVGKECDFYDYAINTLLKENLVDYQKRTLHIKGWGETSNHKNAYGWRVEDTRYVYVMESMGLYKIGFSNNPESRYLQLKTGSPKLRLIYQKKTNFGYQLEHYLHDLFSKKRVDGEWFSLTYEDLAYIESVFDFEYCEVLKWPTKEC